MPVDSPPAIANRQPPFTIILGYLSSLHNRSVNQNLQKKEILKSHQTKLRSLLESTKACEKQAKTKLSEAESAPAGSLQLCFRGLRAIGAPGFGRMGVCVSHPFPDCGRTIGTSTSLHVALRRRRRSLAYINRPTCRENTRKHAKNIHTRKLECLTESIT